MIALLVVTLVLGNEGRGELPVVSEQERNETRLKAGAGIGGTIGLAKQAKAMGPAIRLELGSMFGDRFGVSALIDVSSQIGVSTLMGGASFSYLLLDQLAISAGLAFAYVGATGWEEEAAAQGLVIPLRADVMFAERGPGSVGRRGAVLGLMAAPGISRLSSNGAYRTVPVGTLNFTFIVGLSFGYAVW